jgi:hypothetical protein
VTVRCHPNPYCNEQYCHYHITVFCNIRLYMADLCLSALCLDVAMRFHARISFANRTSELLHLSRHHSVAVYRYGRIHNCSRFGKVCTETISFNYFEKYKTYWQKQMLYHRCRTGEACTLSMRVSKQLIFAVLLPLSMLLVHCITVSHEIIIVGMLPGTPERRKYAQA